MAGTAVRRRLTWLLGEVEELIEETPDVRSIALSVPGWPGHLPGQHVDLRLTAEDGYQAQRSYSIATPDEPRRLALTVERVPDGEVSAYLLDELRVADALELRGPIGGYFVWAPDGRDPLLLIGAGSGVVPLMAIVRQRVRTGSSVAVRLLLSSRSWEQVIYRRELERLAAEEDGIRVVHTLTRSQPPGWTGYRRRVDDEMIREVAPPREDRPACFVCGPTGFVEAVAAGLVALGHDPARVKTERFGPSGGGG
jgi:ferredoxin-NADP reductase